LGGGYSVSGTCCLYLCGRSDENWEGGWLYRKGRAVGSLEQEDRPVRMKEQGGRFLSASLENEEWLRPCR